MVHETGERLKQVDQRQYLSFRRAIVGVLDGFEEWLVGGDTIEYPGAEEQQLGAEETIK